MEKKGPKYKHIVNDILNGIESGKYNKGDKIPSINNYIYKFQLSRDTVFTGLQELKHKGIIESQPGVGYYISSTSTGHQKKVFLLFNEFNIFKEDLYNSFIKALKGSVKVEIFFHHYNRDTFLKLIDDAYGKYTHYVVMPGKINGVTGYLNKLKAHVYVLDHVNNNIKNKFPGVYQNFRKDTFNALEYGLKDLMKYRKLIMIQRAEKEPYERFLGLKDFCKKHMFEFEFRKFPGKKKIQEGAVYMIVNDRDLVELIRKSEREEMIAGKDFGIISYNETPLKEILAGGITTLSTDFKKMGETLARLINDNKKESIENPWQLNIRNSL